MLAVIAILVFLVVALAAFAVFSLWDERNAKARLLRERLSTVEKAAERQPSPELAILRDEMLSEIPALDNILRRSERVSALQTMLEQANVKSRAGNFLMICFGVAAVTGIIVDHLEQVSGLRMDRDVGRFFLPYSYASYLRNKRFQKFEERFPEAIDTLARAVRAGHAFTTALEMIGNEVSEPVAGEFRKLYEEQKYGLPVRDALKNLVDRIPLVDVKFFVTAVMLQRETAAISQRFWTTCRT